MPVRVRGLIITVVSALATWLAYVLLLQSGSSRVSSAAAAPLAGVFWGLIELVSGVPLPELQARWGKLSPGIQQGLGGLVILMAVALFILAIRLL
jgi:hypothetical protein